MHLKSYSQERKTHVLDILSKKCLLCKGDTDRFDIVN